MEWCCPQAIPLIARDASHIEGGECRDFVSVSQLSRTFQFHGVYDGRPMHPANIWPQGPNMLVRVDDLSMLLDSSVGLSAAQLVSIIDGHGVFV